MAFVRAATLIVAQSIATLSFIIGFFIAKKLNRSLYLLNKKSYRLLFILRANNCLNLKAYKYPFYRDYVGNFFDVFIGTFYALIDLIRSYFNGSIHQLEKEEVMKKEKEEKAPGKTKGNPKTKEGKENKKLNKLKMPTARNYYPEELPKR